MRATRRDVLAVIAGVAVCGGLTLVDALAGLQSIVIGTVVLGPFVTALLSGPRATAGVAALAVTLAVVSGAWHHNFGSSAYLLRMWVIMSGGGLAVIAAFGRSRSALVARRFDLLAAVSDVADGTFDLTGTVERINALIVPAFADICVIDVTRGDHLERLSVRVAGPDGARDEAFLAARRPAPRTSSLGAQIALDDGGARLLDPMTDAMLERFALDERDLEGMRRLGICSTAIVPLRARRRNAGALTLSVTRHSGRRYSEDDLRFFGVLAGRVSLALDNAGLTRQVSQLERQLQLSLGGLAEAVSVLAPDGRPIYANQAAADLMGVPDGETYCSMPLEELTDGLRIFDEDGHPLRRADLPGLRLLAGAEDAPAPVLLRFVVGRTGREHWIYNNAGAVRDEDGDLVRVINVLEDVTEIKRAEAASRLLAQAGEALASSLDYTLTLQRVAELAVPRLADWCTLAMPDGRGYLRQVAVAHADPEKVALALRLGERYPDREDAAAGPAAVMRNGVPVFANEITEEGMRAFASDDEHFELLRSLGLRAAMLVPIEAAGRALGTLTLIHAESGRSFTDDDLALATELARRAGTAIENARLYTLRADIAETLQRGLRPPEIVQPAGWEVATLYRPAGELNAVGGDFYDLFPVQDGFAVLIGDVVGHGAEAAALTSLARFTLRTVSELTGDPTLAASRLNAALRSRGDVSLCTAICLHVGGPTETPGAARVRIVDCGHPEPLLLRDGTVQAVGRPGGIAGAFEDERWEAAELELLPGDALVLYTDGVTDAVGVEDRFGEPRLHEALAALPRDADADAIISALAARLDAFGRGPRRDDEAIVALRFTATTTARRPAAPPDRGEPAGTSG